MVGEVKTESPKVKAIQVPELKELFTPCPICGGTLDIDLLGHVFCHSCQQEWMLIGKPIVEDDGAVKPQTIEIDVDSSLSIENLSF